MGTDRGDRERERDRVIKIDRKDTAGATVRKRQMEKEGGR
jgi:hypothetical protein